MCDTRAYFRIKLFFFSSFHRCFHFVFIYLRANRRFAIRLTIGNLASCKQFSQLIFRNERIQGARLFLCRNTFTWFYCSINRLKILVNVRHLVHLISSSVLKNQHHSLAMNGTELQRIRKSMLYLHLVHFTSLHFDVQLCPFAFAARMLWIVVQNTKYIWISCISIHPNVSERCNFYAKHSHQTTWLFNARRECGDDGSENVTSKKKAIGKE